MHFAQHFDEILSELSDAGAEFLIVGAYALSAHVRARATKDLDLWVRPSKENAARVWRALAKCGAPFHQVTVDDFAVTGTIYQMGYPPNRIDILTSITGLTFDDAWPKRIVAKFGSGEYPVLGRDELIANKEMVARPQDVVDVDLLRRFSKR